MAKASFVLFTTLLLFVHAITEIEADGAPRTPPRGGAPPPLPTRPRGAPPPLPINRSLPRPRPSGTPPPLPINLSPLPAPVRDGQYEPDFVIRRAPPPPSIVLSPSLPPSRSPFLRLPPFPRLPPFGRFPGPPAAR